MTYTLEIINDLRQQVAQQLLEEEKQRMGNDSLTLGYLSYSAVEDRLQTLIMAGVGDPANTERKTSPEMAQLATEWMKVEVDDLRDMNEATAVKTKLVIRSLAASVLSQA